MSIKVFTATELKNALIADADNTFKLETKKGEQKGKAKYANAKFSIGADKNKEGWFSIKDIPLSRGVADPKNASDKRNEYTGTRSQLETSLSRAGDWGESMNLLQPVWLKEVNRLVGEDEFSLKGRQIHDLLGLEYSDDYKKKNPGKVVEDPNIKFKIDFSVFPEKYPHKSLRGQPKTQIYDYNTAYTDEKGFVQYKLATVEIDGKQVLVNDENMHLFITDGSIIRSGRVMMSSACQVSSWISMPALMTRCVIEQGGDEGFTDEPQYSIKSTVQPVVISNNKQETTNVEFTANTTVTTVTTVTNNTTDTAVTNDAVVTNNAEQAENVTINDDEVNDLLNAM